ncbi:MAG: NAD-dependent epimerase/dehydratase family protein [bacterium]|nr:NAD-dependent epimerase/dehydratase family protein [bacterium]MDZ4285101.1 NAD-dependent epimerase/dehydratase family protein [Patescibacteria group bacterium]
MNDIQRLFTEDIRTIVALLGGALDQLAGKTVLITGGGGFLGRYLVATLVALNRERFERPCSIVVLDNYITGVANNPLFDFSAYPEVRVLEHDVRFPLPEKLSAAYIIHAAGLASPVYYRKFPVETIEVAVNGTKHLLEFARERGIEGMLYFSSSEIYGDPVPEFVPTPEHYWGRVSAVGPRACYDESKRLGETLCSIYHEYYRVPVSTVRPFNVYGPGMRADDYRVIPTFSVQGLRGEPLTVHDHGRQTRTFCYITDAVHGFLKVLVAGKRGEAYNVGHDREEITMRELAELMSGMLPERPEVRLVSYPDAYPAGEPQRRCPDLTKSRRDLGYSPAIDLRTGLARTLSYYRALLADTPQGARAD